LLLDRSAGLFGRRSPRPTRRIHRNRAGIVLRRPELSLLALVDDDSGRRSRCETDRRCFGDPGPGRGKQDSRARHLEERSDEGPAVLDWQLVREVRSFASLRMTGGPVSTPLAFPREQAAAPWAATRRASFRMYRSPA